MLLDAYLSSQEETMFGDFLEGLAIEICKNVYGGRKSLATGIDLEFDLDKTRYIVAIKSGPNWGNSSQISKMKNDFERAIKIIHTSNSKIPVIAINGCCYGRDNNPSKAGYQKLCGQRFWSFISGEDNLYTEIIEPLGYKAKEKTMAFEKAYAEIIIGFTAKFYDEFCIDKKRIDWGKIVRLNSAVKKTEGLIV